jgi:amino acid transporter
VLAVYYLSFFVPALREGATIGGIEFSAGLLSWLVALIIIWGLSFLQIRGARLSGLFTNWLGIFMILPLVLLSILGIYQWFSSDVTVSLPFLPEGESLVGAFSVGLFIVMWNYMGWELPSVAGDEIVKPRRTYTLAMVLTLIAAILTYFIPVVAGLYGGAGEGGRYQLWGIEGGDEGIGVALEEYGVNAEQLESLGVDASHSIGWEFPEIGYAVGNKVGGPALGTLVGSLLTIAAVLSMIGLFTGNSLGGSRVPFAMAEDGMMPRWMVKVHSRWGTPWVAIVVVGIFYSVFATQAFAYLVVADVFLQLLVVLAEFAAMWKLRFSYPDVPRQRVPGGIPGMVLVTLGPLVIIVVAVYSQFVEEGLGALGWALLAGSLGVILYFPIRKYVKPGVPDVNPFAAPVED